jgi:hypothetical protein
MGSIYLHYRFGGGATSTALNPWVAIATVLAIALILARPRKDAIVPFLLAIFLIPKGQVVVIGGLHFFVYRLILLAGLSKWMISRQSSPLVGGFNRMDRLVILLAFSCLIVFSLQWREAQALIKATGDFLDTMGGYFALRFLIRDRQDIRKVIKVFAFVAIVMGVCMLNEQRTRVNVFGLLGGTAAIPEIRNGAIRSQGVFQHSILAGTFGATAMPLLVWLWSDRKSRLIAFLGLIGTLAMTVTPHSSTTLGTYAAGVFALCLWPLRRNMPAMRFGIFAALIGLEIVMTGPVWSLLEHINLTGSSESYHRYQLIDTFIRHFSDWWLLGTRDNGSWGWEMIDTSNQYVTYGVNGGLIAFVLFIALLSKAFGMIGDARKLVSGNSKEEWFVWCVGAAMFAHLVAYFGIDYFDQMQFAWLALLAMISALSIEPGSFEAGRMSRDRVGKEPAWSYAAAGSNRELAEMHR